MSLDKIVSIPGMPGLFKVIAKMRNEGFIIESLSDQKRTAVTAMSKAVSLKDVSIYTVEGNLPLNDVFFKMKENDAEVSAITPKSESADLRSLLKKLVPDFDEDRVHISDIRKMINWFSLLKNIVDFKIEEPEQEKVETPDMNAEAIVDEPVTKPAKVKTPKAKTADTGEDKENKPVAKKRAAKKTAS